jgi:hypothetical protein
LQRALVEYRGVGVEAVEVVAGRMFAVTARDRMMMPRIFQPPEQERKTPAAVRKADAERAGQPVKRST